MDARLHCVYLLTSLDPACRDSFYIGYTTNPLRRLRQHNGELTNGAWTTKCRGRPWSLVCFVSGFPEDRVGLKFEWCWQHPFRATMIREALATGYATTAGTFAREDGDEVRVGLSGTTALSQQTSMSTLSCRHNNDGSAELLRQRAVPRRADVTAITSLRKIYQAVAVLHILLRCPLFQQLSLRLNIVDPTRFEMYCAAMPKSRHPLLAPLLHDPGREQLLLTVAVVTEAELVDWMASASHIGAAAASFLDTTAGTQMSHINSISECDQRRGDSESLRCRSATDGGMSYSAADGSSQLNLSQVTALTTATSRANSNASANLAARLQQLVCEGLAKDVLAQKSGTLFCTLCSLPLEYVDRVMYCQRDGGAPQSCALRAHIVCLALWCFYRPRGVLGQQQQQQAPIEGESDSLHNHNGDATTSGIAHPSDGLPHSLSQTNVSFAGISTTLIPTSSALCPLCDHILLWGVGVQQLKQRSVWVKHSLTSARQAQLDDALRERLRAMESCATGNRGHLRRKATGSASLVHSAGPARLASQQETRKRSRTETDVDLGAATAGTKATDEHHRAMNTSHEGRNGSRTLAALNDDEEEPLIRDDVEHGSVLVRPLPGASTAAVCARNDDLDWWMDLQNP